MTIHDFNAYLQANIEGNNLLLPLSGVPGTNYPRLLEILGIKNGFTLRMENPQISVDENKLELTAINLYANQESTAENEEPGLPYNKWNLKLVCTPIGNDLNFEVECTQVEKQSIEEIFKHVPQMRFNQGGAMVLTDASFIGSTISGGVLAYSTTSEDDFLCFTGTSEKSCILDIEKSELGKLLWDYLDDKQLYLNGTKNELLSKIYLTNPEKPLFYLYAETGIHLEKAIDLGTLQADILGTGLFITNNEPDNYSFEDKPENICVSKLYMHTSFGPKSQKIKCYLSVNLHHSYGFYTFSCGFTEGINLSKGIKFIEGLFGKDDLITLPSELTFLNNIALQAIEVVLNLSNPILPSIYQVNILISTLKPWKTPIPYVTLEDVGLSMTVYPSDFTVLATIFGAMRIADRTSPDNANEVYAGVKMELPSMDLYGRLSIELETSLSEMIVGYFKDIPERTPKDIPVGLKAVDASLYASWQNRSFETEMEVKGNWPITIAYNTFSLEEIKAKFLADQSGIEFTISGYVSLKTAQTTKAEYKKYLLDAGLASREELANADDTYDFTPTLFMEAGYDKHWYFRGGLSSGQLNLIDFIISFFSNQPPKWLPKGTVILLTDLYLEYQLMEGNPFTARAALASEWPVDMGNYKLMLSAAAEISRRKLLPSEKLSIKNHKDKDGDMYYAAWLEGTGKLGDFEVSARADFKSLSQKPDFLFTILLGKLELSAAATQITGKNKNKHYAFTFGMDKSSVGEMVEFFASIASPNQNFRLEAPWTFLHSIKLNGIRLYLDPTDQILRFTYPVIVNNSIIKIESVGLKYDWSAGDRCVEIEITGEFLFKKYGSNNPLTWDALNDSPPANNVLSLFDLKFAAIGQRVAFNDRLPNDIAGVIRVIKKAMVPIKEPNKSPFESGSISFSNASNMLVAFDADIAKMMSLQLVFNDPRVYGIGIRMEGENAGSLNGFYFELVYTKNNNIGCFHAELTLPYAFRRIDFQEFAISIGRMRADIFTNGNFEVDLGFPHRRNFSNSFELEVFPFKGRGGILLGSLNSNTTSKVPVAKNGFFSPVITFGLGLSVGVGKSFNNGSLSADAYVMLFGIVEGVMAWFTPTRTSEKHALFYRVTGVVGVEAKLAGKVNFGPVSVSVQLKFVGQFTLALESYRKALVEISFYVSATASVKIVFIRINFSFNLRLSLSFTIGAYKATPWRTSSLYNVYTVPRIQKQRISDITTQFYLNKILKKGIHINALDSDYNYPTLKWDNYIVFPDKKLREIPVRVLPFNTFDNIPVGEGTTQDYRTVFLLQVDSHNTHGFSTLVEAFFRRGLIASSKLKGNQAEQQNIVTLGELRVMVNKLLNEEKARPKFSIENLETFFKNNLCFQLSGIPIGNPSEYSGVSFPMPPHLKATIHNHNNPDITISYSKLNPITSTYIQNLREYYNNLYSGIETGNMNPRSDKNDTVSAPQWIFEGYFYMLTRIAFENALNLMETMNYTFKKGQKINDIVQEFPPIPTEYILLPFDSVQSISLYYGLTEWELIAFNPDLVTQIEQKSVGDTISLSLGITSYSFVLKNAHIPLAENVHLKISNIKHTVQQTDTLASIAIQYNISGFELFNSNFSVANILEEDNFLHISSYFAEMPRMLNVPMAAAIIYSRAFRKYNNLTQWYVEAILSRNTKQSSDLHKLIQEQQVKYIEVPLIYGNTNDDNWLLWEIFLGDTVEVIATYMALNYQPSIDITFDLFLQKTQRLNEDFDKISTKIKIPELKLLPIYTGESLQLLSERLFISESDLYTKIERQKIWKPFSKIALPTVEITTQNTTLNGLSEKYRINLHQLTKEVENVKGLFAEHTECELPVLFGCDSELLINKLLSQKVENIEGNISRYMLNGQRVLNPSDNKKMMSLYTLTGQQFNLIDMFSEDFPLEIIFEKELKADWIIFTKTETVNNKGEIGNRTFKDFLHLNPAYRNFAHIPEGKILAIDLLTGISFQLEKEIYAKSFSDNVLIPAHTNTEKPIKQLPVVKKSDAYHKLKNVISYTSGNTIKKGLSEMNIFFIDDKVKPDLEKSKDWKTSVIPINDENINSGKDLKDYAWGTLFCIDIMRTETKEIFDVRGADADEQLKLNVLYKWLDEIGDLEVQIIFEANPNEGYTTKFASIETELCYLIKTNYTTITAEPRVKTMESEMDEQKSYANIEDSKRFISLLWQCTSVGGGGFNLYLKGEKNVVLPSELFTEDGSGKIWILATEKDKTTLSVQHNILLTSDFFDRSLFELYLTSSDKPVQKEEYMQPEGIIAFQLELLDTSDKADKQSATQTIYNLPVFKLLGNNFIKEQDYSMPVFPTESNNIGKNKIWDYPASFPLTQYMLNKHLPKMEGLPSPDNNPYAYIATTYLNKIKPEINIALKWNDITGNQSTNSGHSTLNAGYTDEIIPLSAWPDTTSSYKVYLTTPSKEGLEERIILELYISHENASSLSRDILKNKSKILKNLALSVSSERFEDDSTYETMCKLYYQFMQPDISAHLSTSLHPHKISIEIEQLQKYIKAVCIFTNVAQTINPAYIEFPNKDEINDLQSAIEKYALNYEKVAEANKDIPINTLFKKYIVPLLVPFEEGAFPTDDIFKGYDILNEEENKKLILREGVVLHTKAYKLNLIFPEDKTPGSPFSIKEATIAAEKGNSTDDQNEKQKHTCTCEGIARAMQYADNILEVGSEFEYNGIKVYISDDNQNISFTDIAHTINEEYTKKALGRNILDGDVIIQIIDPIKVALLSIDNPIFKSDAELFAENVVTLSDDTLIDLEAKYSEIINLNKGNYEDTKNDRGTQNIFPVDATVFCGESSIAQSKINDLSLSEAAPIMGISETQFLYHNSYAKLKTILFIPEALSIPNSDTFDNKCYNPYYIFDGKSLSEISELFEVSRIGGIDGLAEINRYTPSLIKSGSSFSFEENIVYENRSLDEVYSSYSLYWFYNLNESVNFKLFVNEIKDRSDIFSMGTLLTCPPALLPRKVSWNEAAKLYGVDELELAKTNMYILDTIVEEELIKILILYPSESQTWPIWTAKHDSLHSFLSKASKQSGKELGLEYFLGLNGNVEMLRMDAKLILPVKELSLKSELDNPNTSTFKEDYFELKTSIHLKRNISCMNPKLAENINTTNTAITNITPNNQVIENGELTNDLRPFARYLQEAFYTLTLMYKTSSEPDISNLWLVVKNYPKVESQIPVLYSIKPLWKRLLTCKDVPIRILNFEGILDASDENIQHLSFENIDGNLLVRNFVNNLEDIINSDLCMRLYQLEDNTHPILDQLLNLKRQVAACICKDIAPVSTLNPKPLKANIDKAKKEWMEYFMQTLSGYCSGDLMLQYLSSCIYPREKMRLSGFAKFEENAENLKPITEIQGAKISLDGDNCVHFIAKTSHLSENDIVDLSELKYHISMLEYDIHSEKEGYEDSKWFTPVSHMDSSNIDISSELDIVSLKRNCPIPPVANEHICNYNKNVNEYEEVLLWNYACSFTVQISGQDEFQLELIVNEEQLKKLKAENNNLFLNHLLQYQSVASEISSILLKEESALPEIREQENKKLIQTTKTFNQLSSKIIEEWGKHKQESHTSLISNMVKDVFTQTIMFEEIPSKKYAETGENVIQRKLILKKVKSNRLPWPNIQCYNLKGEEQKLIKKESNTNEWIYYFSDDCKFDSTEILKFSYNFPNLHVLDIYSVQSFGKVIRENIHPYVRKNDTNIEFQYGTSYAFQNSVCTPYLSLNKDLDIGKWTDDLKSNPLIKVFNKWFIGFDYPNIDVTIYYSYLISGSSEYVKIPVALCPIITYSDNMTEYILKICNEWILRQNPSTYGGRWYFDIRLYKSEKNEEKLLVHIENIFSDLN